MKRKIIIGDIHGCYNTLISLLKKIDYTSETDDLIFVGDYIDRGNNSCEVVSMLRKLQEQVGKEKVICLRGNHEQMAVDYFKRGDNTWTWNGHYATLESYDLNGKDIHDDIPWFDSLPYAAKLVGIKGFSNMLICHAGLTHPMIDDNSIDDLLWGRDWITTDDRQREMTVVFGHTPSRNGRMYTTMSGDICIDSGCVYGGNLCSLVLRDDGKNKVIYEPLDKRDRDDD